MMILKIFSPSRGFGVDFPRVASIQIPRKEELLPQASLAWAVVRGLGNWASSSSNNTGFLNSFCVHYNSAMQSSLNSYQSATVLEGYRLGLFNGFDTTIRRRERRFNGGSTTDPDPTGEHPADRKSRAWSTSAFTREEIPSNIAEQPHHVCCALRTKTPSVAITKSARIRLPTHPLSGEYM